MGRDVVRRAFQTWLGIILILSVIQVIPFQEPLVENASAGSSWVQTTEADFNAGIGKNITITPDGNVTLDLETNYIEDNFFDESMIDYKNNVNVDTIEGEAKLLKNKETEPEEQWNKTFGGTSLEYGKSVQQTFDSGYIITGGTKSYGAGDYDAWLIKTSSFGEEEWNKTFGGIGWDYGNSIQLTSDDGYIITGETESYGTGMKDVWLIKTDSTGVEEWNKTFGGTLDDRGYSVHQTYDSGYIITGETESYSNGKNDIWLIKTNSTGSEQWNKTFGGSDWDGSYSGQQTTDGGYIIAGRTYSYGAGSFDVWLIKTNNTGSEQWNKTFGGSSSDTGYSVQQTTDAGFIITGSTGSYGAGINDVWLIKTNSTGTEQWNNTFGGDSFDYGIYVQQTTDSRYIITGWTSSFGAGQSDVWLIKTDTNGVEQWNKTFGGGDDDRGYLVQQTSDYGYIIVGFTSSLIASNLEEVWLIKINSSINEQWNRTKGGSKEDGGSSVQQTFDGGYIVTGHTRSYGNGWEDVWLINTNNRGVEEWNKTFGGNLEDRGSSVRQTFDGGYIIAGFTSSYGAGGDDVWLIKTNSTGSEQWNKTFGGGLDDGSSSVRQTYDGGYIITGFTRSYGAGQSDVWLIKTNSTGVEQWNRTFGGSTLDGGYSLQLTIEGGFIITGYTYSYGAGNQDVWLIKTNSTGGEEWNNTFGGGGWDDGYSVHQTTDGGYIIAAATSSYGAGSDDLWLIKTNDTGFEQWNRTFGGNLWDEGYGVQQTFDGGYIITGYTENFGGSSYELWVIKTDSTGEEQWNMTFGGWSGERGKSIQQTYDGGYIIAGNTFSYGAGLTDVWLIKINSGYLSYPNGELTSIDLLQGQSAYSFDEFSCNVLIQPETDIKVQFSQDSISWYNTSSGLNGWNYLSSGVNVIDLSPLNWNGDNFYYRMNFTSEGENTSVLRNINLYYQQYLTSGTLESQPFDSGGDVNWQTLNWSAYIPLGTEIKFQLRSAVTQAGLSSKNFVGYDGTDTTYYTNMGSTIWSGHDAERWIQYKVYLNTSNGSIAPVLEDVTIQYNRKPGAPILTTPSDDIWTNDNTPEFTWTFIDTDGTQSWFQVLIDNDTAFDSVDYDSGQVISSTSSYTPGVQIADGIWYWKVRTNDSDGDWGPYSNFRTIKIDTSSPDSFIPLANPSGWTTNTQPQIIFFTTDSASGISHYEVDIAGGGFTSQMSPYTLPAQPDGTHNITVRAFDIAGNYIDGFVNVYIDTTDPLDFTPSADPSGWTNNTQPAISFSTTDNTSGIDHYEVKVDSGTFSTQISPYILPSQTDGMHIVTVRAFDKAGNNIDRNVNIYIDNTKPTGFTPISNITEWTVFTQPEITFGTADETSGIDHYELRIDENPFSIQTSPYILPPQSDGIHNITVRAYDTALNYFDSYVDIYFDTTAPVIIHTPVTSVTNDTQVDITANVVDVSSGIDAVILYFKNPSDDTYISLIMNQDGNNFTAQISAGAISMEGIEYYIKAIDKSSPANVIYYGYNGQTALEPSSMTDIDITVTLSDDSPPAIDHIPVTESTVGANITISAIVTDASGVDYVELFYKKKTDSIYIKTSMSKSGNVYTANILGNDVTTDGIEYYIKAKDNAPSPHIIFYGASGLVSTEPGTSNDIDITITVEEIILPRVISRTPEGNSVIIGTTITLSFNKAMDHESTEGAFVIIPKITGEFSWDDNTNKLIFKPNINLNYSTTYTVKLTTTALDSEGNTLENDYQWEFTTSQKSEEGGKESFWETWEPIITGMTILVSMLIALFGFIQIRKKRGKLRQYLERIDDTFNEHKENPEECEKELIALREDIKGEVTAGKLEEGHFLILDKKIDDYLRETKAMKDSGVKGEPKEDISEAVSEEEVGEEVEEGELTEEEPKEIDDEEIGEGEKEEPEAVEEGELEEDLEEDPEEETTEN